MRFEEGDPECDPLTKWPKISKSPETASKPRFINGVPLFSPFFLDNHGVPLSLRSGHPIPLPKKRAAFQRPRLLRSGRPRPSVCGLPSTKRSAFEDRECRHRPFWVASGQGLPESGWPCGVKGALLNSNGFWVERSLRRPRSDSERDDLPRGRESLGCHGVLFWCAGGPVCSCVWEGLKKTAKGSKDRVWLPQKRTWRPQKRKPDGKAKGGQDRITVLTENAVEKPSTGDFFF
jgi:hypothetical protein